MQRVVMCVAAALVLAGTSEPRAIAAPDAAAVRERIVEVVLAAPTDRLGPLEDRIREHLGPLPAELQIVHAPAIAAATVIDDGGGPAFTKVWIDAVGHADIVRIYIVDAAADRILIRKVQLTNGLDEVAIDEIGLIVEASVDALLQGGALGVTREAAAAQLGVTTPPARAAAPAPAPTRAPARAVVPSQRAVLEIVGGHAVKAWGDRVVQHGPWIDVGLAARRPRLDVGAVIEAAAVLPSRVRGSDVELTIAGGSVRALAHVAGRIAARTRWEARLGVGLDVLRDRSRPLREGAVGSPATTRSIGVLALRSGPAFALGRARDRVLLRVHATLDVEFAGVRYVTTEGARVFDPWVARPGVVLAIGWSREWSRGGRARPVQTSVEGP